MHLKTNNRCIKKTFFDENLYSTVSASGLEKNGQKVPKFLGVWTLTLKFDINHKINRLIHRNITHQRGKEKKRKNERRKERRKKVSESEEAREAKQVRYTLMIPLIFYRSQSFRKGSLKSFCWYPIAARRQRRQQQQQHQLNQGEKERKT